MISRVISIEKINITLRTMAVAVYLQLKEKKNVIEFGIRFPCESPTMYEAEGVEGKGHEINEKGV
jgi:hypothetical protein